MSGAEWCEASNTFTAVGTEFFGLNIVCPSCGRRVRANLVTGRIARHKHRGLVPAKTPLSQAEER